eukprot:m.133422 g.133422  ORF g.133422 m.133422 type:complete len:105 (+) comp11357_c0_seq3:136-450(+)
MTRHHALAMMMSLYVTWAHATSETRRVQDITDTQASLRHRPAIPTTQPDKTSIVSTPLPSILWVVADDLGYTDLSYKGGEFPAPTLSSLHWCTDGTWARGIRHV